MQNRAEGQRCWPTFLALSHLLFLEPKSEPLAVGFIMQLANRSCGALQVLSVQNVVSWWQRIVQWVIVLSLCVLAAIEWPALMCWFVTLPKESAILPQGSCIPLVLLPVEVCACVSLLFIITFRPQDGSKPAETSQPPSSTTGYNQPSLGYGQSNYSYPQVPASYPMQPVTAPPSYPPTR